MYGSKDIQQTEVLILKGIFLSHRASHDFWTKREKLNEWTKDVN